VLFFDFKNWRLRNLTELFGGQHQHLSVIASNIISWEKNTLPKMSVFSFDQCLFW